MTPAAFTCARKSVDERCSQHNMPRMSRLKHLLFLAAASVFGTAALAEDQAKTIVNSLDPKKMNELFSVSKLQPDAALASLAPANVNKFRFLFVWPASNPVMTFERVGASFTERLALLAQQMQHLALGFCLPSRSMYFGTTFYGENEVNVAYRDIEVRYQAGWRSPCAGRYISMAELEQDLRAVQASAGYGLRYPSVPPKNPPPEQTPQDGLKPFLKPSPISPDAN